MTATGIEARTKRIMADFGWRERLLYLFCVDPRLAYRERGARCHDARWTFDNPLSVLRSEFADFDAMIRGRRVMDYGCGEGYQAVAMADAGAAEVVGVDIDETALAFARNLAGRRQNVAFGRELPREFDVAVSFNSCEHFADPELSLREMRAGLRPGGRILITFSPPWLSPWGAHMRFFCRLPWVHLLFSEETVHRVRQLYREGGDMTYEPYLNRMTLQKFISLLERTGPWRKSVRVTAVKGMTPLVRWSAAREYFCGRVSAALDVPT